MEGKKEIDKQRPLPCLCCSLSLQPPFQETQIRLPKWPLRDQLECVASQREKQPPPPIREMSGHLSTLPQNMLSLGVFTVVGVGDLDNGDSTNLELSSW
jgi:hypothetical protein